MEYMDKIRTLAKEFWNYEDLVKDKFSIEEINSLEDLLRCAVLYKIREKTDIEKMFWLKDDEED